MNYEEQTKYVHETQKIIQADNKKILADIKPSKKYLKGWETIKIKDMSFWQWVWWCVDPGKELT